METITKLPEVKQVSAEELRARLRHFETQYRMSSQEFYEQVQRGLLEEKDEFIDWLGYYEVYRTFRR